MHDLRAYLRLLEARGELVRVHEPVDPVLESTMLCKQALISGGPALLMEQPVGAGHMLLGNLFGTRARIEAALGGRPLASLRELGQLLAAIREPRCISPTASPAAGRFRSPGSAPIDRDDLDRLLEPFQDLRPRLRNAVGSADAVERLDADEDLARPGGRSDP